MIDLLIKKHVAVLAFALLVIFAGIFAYIVLPRETAPELKQPYIFVTTAYPGVAAKDVESLVTRVIEEEIEGIEGIKEISSSSAQSISSIFVEFTSDVDVETALRRVRDKVDIAKADLPEDVEEPFVQELSASNWPILIIALTHAEGLEKIDKTANVMKERLKRVNGVLDVKIAGNLEKEVAIELDPVKLQHYGFSLNDVIFDIQSENTTIPGGLLKSDAKNYSIAVTGEIKDPKIFEDIIISAEGKKIRLAELGKVKFDFKDPDSYSRLNGLESISLSVTKRIGVNIIDIVKECRSIIDDMKSSLPKGTDVVYSYDESVYIHDMVADLENNMFSGFVLVILVTLIFLGRVNSLFVSLAIPFSMFMSFFILQMMGITLNMIVLFSLILALGMLVDNGIVIVENIYRHAGMGKSKTQAAIDGSKEVAGPIITSTLTTCLAFSPIIFMPGVMGDFMSYLPKTLIVVLSCSLLVALTINPVFCSQYMNLSEKNRKRIMEGSGGFVRLQNWYEGVARWALEHKALALFLSFAITIIGITLYSSFGKEATFFPEIDPSDLEISLEAPQGTVLDDTDRMIRKIENAIPDVPASLKNYQAISGQAGGGGFSVGTNLEFHKGSIRISFKPYMEREIPGNQALVSYEKALKNFTGADVKIRALDNAPPAGHPISFEVTGADYAVLGKISEQMVRIFKDYPELELIDSDYEPARPEMSIIIDRKKAAFYGLSTRDIASTIRNAINGSNVGKFRQADNEYDIVVRYDDKYRNSIDHLSTLQVINHDGDRIPINSVAEVTQKSNVAVIRHLNLKRTVSVYADFKKGVPNTYAVKAQIKEKVKKLSLPPGYLIDTGEGERFRNESQNFLMQAFIVALFLIFIVLIAQFNSFVESLIIIASVFLSIGGVFWGYFLTNQAFDIIMSGIGCISLAGVAVNNCIVLVDYTHILMQQGRAWKDAIVEAGRTRLRPVLLTAITTILGLIPMAFGVSFDVHKFVFQVGSESSEFWRVFAWAMIFGLSFATIMTLVMVPTMLAVYYSIKYKKIGKLAEV